MKKIKSKVILPGFIVAAFFLIAADANSQYKKLPDGSIVYSDGTRRLPNGTVIYKGGTNNNGTANNNGTISLPDGSVIYRDGTRGYPNSKKIHHHARRNNSGWLPPGQAKKIYGGSAKDYAPGQQKKWKGNGKWKGHGKGKGHDD
jgi:hypothetical protein